MKIEEAVKAAHHCSRDHGWWDEQKKFFEEGTFFEAPTPKALDPGLVLKTIPEKIALMHSELSEALEEYRSGQDPRRIYVKGQHADGSPATVDYDAETMSGLKPEGFPVELADVIIRVFDLCGALDIDLAEAIRIKMEYNESRPFRHGGKTC